MIRYGRHHYLMELGGVALSAGCDLNSLRPVNIGANSFVYADDGSLLGSIPAERNREPVTMGKISGS